MKSKKILVACGAAVATSLVVARKLEAELKRRHIEAVITTCKTDEINNMADSFNLLITTAPVETDLSIPVIHPVSFLTGIGIEKDMEKIVGILENCND